MKTVHRVSINGKREIMRAIELITLSEHLLEVVLPNETDRSFSQACHPLAPNLIPSRIEQLEENWDRFNRFLREKRGY